MIANARCPHLCPSLTRHAAQSILGFMGSTGVGKATLVDSIPGLLVP